MLRGNVPKLDDPLAGRAAPWEPCPEAHATSVVCPAVVVIDDVGAAGSPGTPMRLRRPLRPAAAPEGASGAPSPGGCPDEGAATTPGPDSSSVLTPGSCGHDDG